MGSPLFSVYLSYRMLIVLFLGFSSGLPLLLVGGTLQAWLTDAKVDVATIGKFALVGLPYALKFLWAPLLDSLSPPFLTRRRGWGIFIQLCLIASLVWLAFSDPSASLTQVAIASLLVAFFSSSQDIVIDALRIEILDKAELGAGGAVTTLGYRLAMIISGAVALAMADHMAWKFVYLAMACVQGLGMIAFFYAPELKQMELKAATFREKVVMPFTEFFSRDSAMEILFFVMIYKLPTLMATSLTTNFLLTLEFSKTEIGLVGKLYGLIATIVGAVVGGAMMTRLGYKRSLWTFGIIQSVAGLSFIILAEKWYGFHFSQGFADFIFPQNWAMLKRLMTEPRHFAMLWVIVVDNFMMGLGVTALVAFGQSICSKQFSGSQYALLSSLTAVSRVILVSQAGVIQSRLGWTPFFLFSMFLAAPGLLMLLRYDHWGVETDRALTSASPNQISRYESTVLLTLFGSLILMTLEPLWSLVGLKAWGGPLALTGALGVLMAMLAGFLKPKKAKISTS